MAGGAQDNDEEISGINVTPLVDVVLVLLIIFMVTANFIVRETVEVDLPRAANGGETVQGLVNVVLDKQGKLFFDGAEVGEDELRRRVAEALVKDKETRAIISADQTIAYGRVMRLIDVVKGQGIAKFALNIEKDVAPTAAPAGPRGATRGHEPGRPLRPAAALPPLAPAPPPRPPPPPPPLVPGDAAVRAGVARRSWRGLLHALASGGSPPSRGQPPRGAGDGGGPEAASASTAPPGRAQAAASAAQGGQAAPGEGRPGREAPPASSTRRARAPPRPQTPPPPPSPPASRCRSWWACPCPPPRARAPSPLPWATPSMARRG